VQPKCLLCPKKGRAMKSTHSGTKWVHVSCALWIPEVSERCSWRRGGWQVGREQAPRQQHIKISIPSPGACFLSTHTDPGSSRESASAGFWCPQGTPPVQHL
jgi:hypothetical protein